MLKADILRFCDARITQKEVIQATFDVQLHLTEQLSKKESDFSEFVETIFEILENTGNIQENALFPFLSITPSILYKIDPNGQELIQRIFSLDLPIPILIPLLHATSEIQLNSNSSQKFYLRLESLINENPASASALLNIVLFLYESRPDMKWATLVRKIFAVVSSNELPDCIYLLHKRRAHSESLASTISSLISGSKKGVKETTTYESDLFLLFVLSSLSLSSVLNALKKLMIDNKLEQLSVRKYNLRFIKSSDIIDCFCGLCSARSGKEKVDLLGNLLFECFVSSQSPDLLTFAFFNEDENKTFLLVSIKAFCICAEKAQQLLASKIDLFSLIYSVSKEIADKIIKPALTVAIQSPSLTDAAIVYLKKLLLRPESPRTIIAIECFCDLLSKLGAAGLVDMQMQVLDALFGLLGSPKLRCLIFRRLASVPWGRFSREVIRKVMDIIVNYEECLKPENYVNLVSEDDEQCIVIKDSPGSLLFLLISLMRKPDDFFDLVRLRGTSFTTDSYFALQLALRGDIYAVLSQYNNNCFTAFCEYSLAIEYYETPEEKKIIKEWCDLSIDPHFAASSLVNQKYNTPIHILILLKAIENYPISKELYEVLVTMFLNFVNPPEEPYKVYCNTEKNIFTKEIFEPVFDLMRDELIILISKNLSLGIVNPRLLLEVMNYEIYSERIISRQHFEAYINILSYLLKQEKETTDALWKIMQRMSFDDPLIMRGFSLLLLNKSQRDEAFSYCELLFACSKGEDDSLDLESVPIRRGLIISICKWLGELVESDKKASEDVINFLFEFFEIPENLASKNVIHRVFTLLMTIAKNLGDKRIDNFDEFKEKTENWLNTHKKQIGAKMCGHVLALIQLHYSETKEGGTKICAHSSTSSPFFQQKWRSRNKWIDQALRENSTSDDDNYADLEGFIVESDEIEDEYVSPEEEENEEEEKKDEEEAPQRSSRLRMHFRRH